MIVRKINLILDAEGFKAEDRRALLKRSNCRGLGERRWRIRHNTSNGAYLGSITLKTPIINGNTIRLMRGSGERETS